MARLRMAWLGMLARDVGMAPSARDGSVGLALLGEPTTKLYRLVALYSMELRGVSDEMIRPGET
jgi:hypothetical protein